MEQNRKSDIDTTLKPPGNFRIKHSVLTPDHILLSFLTKHHYVWIPQNLVSFMTPLVVPFNNAHATSGISGLLISASGHPNYFLSRCWKRNSTVQVFCLAMTSAQNDWQQDFNRCSLFLVKLCRFMYASLDTIFSFLLVCHTIAPIKMQTEKASKNRNRWLSCSAPC